MFNRKILTVVIPTYNRGAKLTATLDSLLTSNTGDLAEVEIIVVDDGSPTPAAPLVDSCTVTTQFTLRCIRQANAGPAAARNTGYRAARGEVVLFVDDDIICPRNLILKHMEAHITHPRSVICGRCPFAKPDKMTIFFRFVDSLNNDPGQQVAQEYSEVPIVASGQISVERSMFDDAEGVYRDDLATPAAEEFELSHRLQERRIKIFLANRIVALHDHPVTLESICRQEYKHALGCGEVAAKCPQTLQLRALRKIIEVNGPALSDSSALTRLKKAFKAMMSAKVLRNTLLSIVRITERLAPRYLLLAPLYKTIIGLHFFAGVRDGLRTYLPVADTHSNRLTRSHAES